MRRTSRASRCWTSRATSSVSTEHSPSRGGEEPPPLSLSGLVGGGSYGHGLGTGDPAGLPPSGLHAHTRYVTADIAAQLTLARAGLATALVPRTAIDPTVPGIRTAPIEDRPILRLLFAATRHTEAANPTTTAVVAALRTAAGQGLTTHLPPA
ncbi:LysR substrate-binding domain-containing protein [Streptomyces sp. NPDC086835]|uniref:LysR substrate-binding domain-containing protein n=1 Tax=Streptomyces sp. NPDC086835 TaxID=3365761 RepID=UPI00380275AD